MSLALDVLRCIVREPGMLTASDIAAEVLPVPESLRIRGVFRSGAHRRTVMAEREAWERQAVGRVSQAIGELVRRGDVEPMRPPTLAAWVATRIESRGLWQTLRDIDRHEEERVNDETIDAWAAMVTEYTKSPGAWRPGKSGAEQESYRALVVLGVLEAPTQRWATEKGRGKC